MTYDELKEIAMGKIESALSMKLDADVTVEYIKALAMLKPDKVCQCEKESIKV